jgi:formate/nitrite transporter FocA (FNT family)
VLRYAYITCVLYVFGTIHFVITVKLHSKFRDPTCVSWRVMAATDKFADTLFYSYRLDKLVSRFHQICKLWTWKVMEGHFSIMVIMITIISVYFVDKGRSCIAIWNTVVFFLYSSTEHVIISVFTFLISLIIPASIYSLFFFVAEHTQYLPYVSLPRSEFAMRQNSN